MSRALSQIHNTNRYLIKMYEGLRLLEGGSLLVMYALSLTRGVDEPWVKAIGDRVEWPAQLSVCVTLVAAIWNYHSHYTVEKALLADSLENRQRELREQCVHPSLTFGRALWLNPAEQHQFGFGVLGGVIGGLILLLAGSGRMDDTNFVQSVRSITTTFMSVVLCQLLNVVCSKAIRSHAKSVATDAYLEESMRQLKLQ